MEVRYGTPVAEKWQHLLLFEQPLSFDEYQARIVDYIFSNREVMLQMAFDFYDCNNDDQVSEYDLYRIFKTYGHSQLLFKPHIEPDLLQML